MIQTHTEFPNHKQIGLDDHPNNDMSTKRLFSLNPVVQENSISQSNQIIDGLPTMNHKYIQKRASESLEISKQVEQNLSDRRDRESKKREVLNNLK